MKAIELTFRRLLLFTLSRLFRRRRPIPADIDFNKCKVLFLRQDLIGDALVSTPVFEALKRHYPGVIIDVLMSPRNHFVLERDPAVRKRWVYRKSFVHILELSKQIRAEEYDFMVDLIDNPSTTSTLWCILGGARWAVGLAKENDFCYDYAAPFLSKDHHHIVDRTANVLTAFRISPQEEKLGIRYFISSEAERFAEEAWKSGGLDGNTVVGVNISAGDEARSWWGSNCMQFLVEIQKLHPGWKALLVFKPEDRPKAESLARLARPAVLSPDTPSFDHAAALVSRLSFLVTPDTSIVQIAAAFNIPALVMHLKISTIHGHLWEPYNSVSENLIASVDNLETIPFSDVVAAFERLSVRQKGQHTNMIKEGIGPN